MPAPLLAAQGQDSTQGPVELLAHAVVLQRDGDHQGAADTYRAALACGADGPALRSNLGAALAALGRYDEAIEQYRAGLSQDPLDFAVRGNLARALYKAGRIDEAASEAELIAASRRDDADTALLLADCRLRLGQNARAIELLEPLRTRPAPERAVYFLLGMAYLGLGRTAEAESALDHILRDDSAESHVLFAAMLVSSRDCARALPEVEKALARQPKVALAHYLKGRCLTQDNSNDWSGATDAFRAELAIDPNHFESSLLLGNVLREGGHAEEAVPHLEHALRLRPDAVAASFALGAAYAGLGRNDEALRLLERAAALAPDHLQTHVQLAIVYHRLGRGTELAREREIAARLQKKDEQRLQDSVGDSLSGVFGESRAARP